MNIKLLTFKTNHTILGDVDVSNFESILANRISKFLSENSLSLNDCIQNSIKTDWYIDLRIGGYIIIQELFYVGYGFNGVPKKNFRLFLKECEWRFNFPSPKKHGLI
jgi:hypothetical protein